MLPKMMGRYLNKIKIYGNVLLFFLLKDKKRYLKAYRHGFYSVKYHKHLTSKYAELTKIYEVNKNVEELRLVEIEPSGFYRQKFPHIVNIGILDFEIDVKLRERNIYLFKNVELRPLNSFVYDNDMVFIPKLAHKTNQVKAAISEDRISLNEIQLVELENIDFNTVFCDSAVSLMGHYSDHFGHFLLEYVERLNHLDKLGVNVKQLAVLLNENLDPNMKDLITEQQLRYGFQMVFVAKNSRVYCKRYFHIDPCSVVCDGANYTSVTDKLYYSSFSQYFMQKQRDSLRGKGRKLYLARRGKRTLLNFKQIEVFFNGAEYEIIENCHELSLNEKIELFGNASYVVGPGGSAFFNCIWCPRDVKILTFINYEIAYDNCLQNMLSEESEIYHIAGKEINYKFYNSDYHIELDEIIHYAKELGFTS
jgi:capsular polysaccharide biosynthesis protein